MYLTALNFISGFTNEKCTNTHHNLLRTLVKRMLDLCNTLHNIEVLAHCLQREVSDKPDLKDIGRQ